MRRDSKDNLSLSLNLNTESPSNSDKVRHLVEGHDSVMLSYHVNVNEHRGDCLSHAANQTHHVLMMATLENVVHEWWTVIAPDSRGIACLFTCHSTHDSRLLSHCCKVWLYALC